MSVPAAADERAARPRGPGHVGPVRALVAGDRATLRLLVERVASEDVEVVAVVGDGETLVEVFRRHRPDVVLAEWRLPRLDGAEALARVLGIDPAARVVFVSTTADPASVRRAVAAGAAGFLLASACEVRLPECLRAAASGRLVVDAATGRSLTGEGGEPCPEEPDGRLSARERAVLRLVAEGCTNNEIAERLGIRLPTVKTHLGRICMKLGVRGRLAAAREAGAFGLL